MAGLETMIAIGAVVIFFGFVLMFMARGKHFFSIGMLVVGIVMVVGGLASYYPCLFLRGAC